MLIVGKAILLRRQTLRRNLLEVVDRIRSVPLPAKVETLLIHDSYFRGEDMPGDLDVVMLAEAGPDLMKFSEGLKTLRVIYALRFLLEWEVKGELEKKQPKCPNTIHCSVILP